MKKVLLGTSALVLAGLMAAPAQAQLEVRVGMDIRAMAAVYNHDRASVTGNTAGEYNTASMRTDWRLPITVSGTADNGLNYGATVRLRNRHLSYRNAAGDASATDQQSVRHDQAFVFLSGAWGRVELGDNFIGIFRDRVTAPVVGIGQIDGESPINAGVASAFSAGSAAVNSQVLYQSPNFSGFRVTASFSPETEQGNAFSTGNAARFKNVYSVSARYSGEFEGIGILIGGGVHGAQRHLRTGNDTDNIRWEVGANVSWGGLAIGGSYWNNGHRVNNNGTVGQNTNGRNDGWTLGATYTMGPWSFGGSVAGATDRPGAGQGVTGFTGQNQTDTLYSVGVNYNVAPGLSLAADFYATDLGSVRKNAGVSNDRVRGTAGVVRARVTF